MKTIIKYMYLGKTIIPMPTSLLLLSILGIIAPYIFMRQITLLIYLIIIGISIFIPFFKNKILLSRSIQTASIGVIMTIFYYYHGYHSDSWVLLLQIISVGSFLFFLLDIDEQITNYKICKIKSIETLTYKRYYEKFATSRCSMDMYMAVLRERNTGKITLSERKDLIRTKNRMKRLYPGYYFFPLTKEQLWRKKLRKITAK